MGLLKATAGLNASALNAAQVAVLSAAQIAALAPEVFATLSSAAFGVVVAPHKSHAREQSQPSVPASGAALTLPLTRSLSNRRDARKGQQG